MRWIEAVANKSSTTTNLVVAPHLIIVSVLTANNNKLTSQVYISIE